MRRPRLSRVSLTLCVGLVVLSLCLWWRSYRRVDTLSHRSTEPVGGRVWGAILSSDGGSVVLHLYARQSLGLRGGEGTTFNSVAYVAKALRSFGPRPPLETRFGFGYRAEMIPSYVVTGIDGVPVAVLPYPWRTAAVPHWLIAVLAGIYPAVAAGRWRSDRRRRARERRGLCPACGYDLRASAGACPECGTPAGRGASGTDEKRGQPFPAERRDAGDAR